MSQISQLTNLSPRAGAAPSSSYGWAALSPGWAIR